MFNLKNTAFSAVVVLLLLSSCDKPQNSLSAPITFKPVFNGKIINCNSQFLHSEQQWHYTQLQFFISDIQAKNNAGEWQNLPLKKSVFQSNNSVLLGEHCDESDTQKPNSTNWQLVLADNTNLNNFSHIRITLGLPFKVNHLNPLTQDSPLNIPSMFWSWQGGHKFLRLELLSASDHWLFHLGSVGCKAASPMRAPLQECLHPNRYTYEFALKKNTPMITLVLDKLLNHINLSEQTSCQSSQDNHNCQTLFENLKALNNESIFRLNEAVDYE